MSIVNKYKCATCDVIMSGTTLSEITQSITTHINSNSGHTITNFVGEETSNNLTVLPIITTASTIGSATQIPVVNFDKYGRITSSSTTVTTNPFFLYNSTGGTINNAKTVYANVLTDSNSNFTINFSALNFTTILLINSQAIFNSQNIGGQVIATLNSITNTTMTGKVVTSNSTSIVLGGIATGLSFAGSNITVSNLIIGF